MGGVTSSSPATFFYHGPSFTEQMSNKHAVFVPSCCRLALRDWLNLSCLLGWPGVGVGACPVRTLEGEGPSVRWFSTLMPRWV